MADFSKVNASFDQLEVDVKALEGLVGVENPAIQAGIDALQVRADALDAEVKAKLG